MDIYFILAMIILAWLVWQLMDEYFKWKDNKKPKEETITINEP